MKVSVAAVIVNDIKQSDQYLLTYRNKNCRGKTDCWALPGGEVEEGETLEEGLIRELNEEVYLGTYSIEGLIEVQTLGSDWLCFVYLVVPSDCKSFKNNEPDKFDEVKWVTITELVVDKVPTAEYSLGPILNIYWGIFNFIRIYDYV